MTNLNLGITPGALGRRPQLRADQIRRDSLTMLAAALADGEDNELQNALDALVDAKKRGVSAGEIALLLDDIEDLAGMGQAVMDLTPSDVGQLAEEAWAALPAAPVDAPTAPQPQPDWVKYTTPRGVRQQRDRRWSA
ncbi:hypothetical protein V2S66_03060 [Streptomyces sp. V4-01]|uniref:Uncharacterized protein n=1 Tax=Actinacidiphila polyblastidii TaxID=3110430 RepID=A0ABU7P569_9ACTN|nr:hypothetical protein [Streptomyces sp. V4-01]